MSLRPSLAPTRSASAWPQLRSQAWRRLPLALMAALVAASGCGSDDIVTGVGTTLDADGAGAVDGSVDGKVDGGGLDAAGDGGHDGHVADTGGGPDTSADADDTATDPDGDDGGAGSDAQPGLDVVALTIDPAALSLPVGGQIAFSLTAKLGDGTSEDVTALAVWTSSAPGIVAVSPGGSAAALAAGSAEIRAQLSGLVATAKVSVVPAALVALTINPAETTLALGAAVQLSAVGTFADGSQQQLSQVVAWSSDKPEIAAVAADGTVTAKAAGAATITAKLGEVSASASVTVLTAKPTGLVLEPVDPTLPVGASLQMSALATYDDGSKADVSPQATWVSGAPDIAAVAAGGTVTAKTVGSAVITVQFAGLEASRIVTVIAPQLASLTIEPASATVAAGGKLALKAAGVWQDGTKTDLTTTVLWSSNPANVASVSNAPGSQGALTALAPGVATITASHAGKSASATITVSKATLVSLAIQPAQPSIPKGVTVQLQALGTFSDGSVDEVTNVVVWGSADAAIATVSSTGKTAGQAQGLGVGKTTITASLDGKVASVTLIVSAAALTTLTVEPASLTLDAGAKGTLKAKAAYSDKSEVDVTASATWSTANPTVAEVANASGSQGQVSAKAEGKTTITATLGSVSGKATVEVKAPSLQELQIGPINPQRKAGEWVQFFVTAVYSNGTTQNVTFQSDWSSSNTAVASVNNGGNQKGRAQGKAAGKATITATFGGKSVSTTLTVTEPTLVAIQISPAYWEMNAGTPMQLQAIAIFSDDSSQNITFQAQWASSDTKIASVGNQGGGGPGGGPGGGGAPKGRVVASTPGTVTITATFQGMQGKATIVVKAAVPVGLTIYPGLQTCAPGQFRQFAVTAVFSDGSSLPVSEAATFTSTAQAVAAPLNGFGQKGFVQCLSPGKATIKATLQGYSAEAVVEVSSAQLEFLAIAPGVATVAAGVPVPLQITAHFSDGTSQGINGQATLTSSDAKIATPIDGGPLSGVVQTLSPGTAVITAAYGGKKATASITVTAATVAEIQVSPAAQAVAPGSYVKYEAVAIMTDNTSQQVTVLASWASSAPTVAAVDNTAGGFGKGLTQAIAAGTSIISATWQGKTGTSTLTVTPATLTEIQVTPFVATLPIGYVTLYKATGIFSDFSTQDLTPLASWTSTKAAVASVSSALGSKGTVTPIAKGDTEIVATFQGKSGKSKLTVSDAKLTTIAVSPATATVAVGKTAALKAVGTFAGGLQLDVTNYVTWLTKPAGTVAVSNAWGSKGEATGLAKGSATVEATRDGVVGKASVTVN